MTISTTAFRLPFGQVVSRRLPALSLQQQSTGDFICHYEELSVSTQKGIHLTDITSRVQEVVRREALESGHVVVFPKHTTTAVVVNEMEPRLVDDVRQYLYKLAPPQYPYLHNDNHLRQAPSDWPGGEEAWKAQEPMNAHSHLLNMLLGSSQTLPVHKGKLQLGSVQSVILVELDGPRERTVAVHITGQRQPSSSTSTRSFPSV
eukprot:gene2835-3098_t